MRIVLMGPPGAGKGTQASRLAAASGTVHMATGDILRAALKTGTALGREAQQYLDSGTLVPDRVVLGMVEERLGGTAARSGFVLDGFPRTVPQAEGLDRILDRMRAPLDAVLLLEVPEEILVGRLAGRRTCPSCGRVYPVQGRPADIEADRCEFCQASLAVRSDDRPETIRRRLAVYRDETEPVVAHYRLRGLVRPVDGVGDMEDVGRRLDARLADLPGDRAEEAQG